MIAHTLRSPSWAEENVFLWSIFGLPRWAVVRPKNARVTAKILFPVGVIVVVWQVLGRSASTWPAGRSCEEREKDPGYGLDLSVYAGFTALN